MKKIVSLIAIAACCLGLASHSRAAAANLLQLLRTIPLEGVEGRIDHMAVDERGQLYVAALGNNTVEVVELATGAHAATIKDVAEPQGIVVVPGSRRVVIASGQDGKCRIYDSSFKLVAQIDDLEDADNVRYDAADQQAIVGYGSGALAFIDPQSAAKVAEVKLDAHPESFQLEESGNRIFVNVPHAEEVAVVDRVQHAVLAKWPLPADFRANFPMALDEADHRLFIGCRKPAKLLVLDTESGKIVTSVDIVGDTDDVFYDRAMGRIYASGGKGAVSVIQQTGADHYEVLGEVATASGGRTSFFAGGISRLYVAVPHRGAQAAQIQVYSLPSPLVQVETLFLPVMGGFNHHSADGKLRRLFLSATTNRTVEVVDLAASKVVRSLPGEGKPLATCFAPDLNILCVTRGKNVQLYDANTLEQLASIPLASGIDELRYDSRAKQLFVGCSKGIATIDLVQRKLLGEIELSSVAGFSVEDDGNRIFACNQRASQISVVDRKKSAAADPWQLTQAAGNSPVAYDAATHRLFVGCGKPAKLLVLDTDSGKTIAGVEIGKGADDLSFDPANKRVYVSCGQGVISVVQQDDADHYRNIANVATTPGARNCVFLPESGEFCVTVGQTREQPAQLLVFQAQP